MKSCARVHALGCVAYMREREKDEGEQEEDFSLGELKRME
jgi:hypothetical protein